MESHDISSPPLPALYHEAMVAYHAYTVRGKPGENFLSFWYHMDSLSSKTPRSDEKSTEEVTDYSIDILKGILVLRNEVAQISSPQIGGKKFKKILTKIRNNSVFPETVEYWETVMSGLDFDHEDGISISEISEAIFQFLKNLASADSVSRTTSKSDLAATEDLERLRTFVQLSLDKLREEVAKETKEMKEKLDEVATAHTTPRPTVPELPIPSRRRQLASSSSAPSSSNRACCGHDGFVENCLIQ